MEKAMTRVGVTLPGPEVVRAGLEVARFCLEYHKSVF